MAGSGLQPAIIAISCVCPAISGFVVGARMYQKRMNGTLAAEDWVIAVSWVLSVVTTVLGIVFSLAMYQGYHDEDIPFQKIDMPRALKILYAMSIAYNPIMCAAKASFIWSLQKLRSPRVWVRRSLWGIHAINGAYAVGHLIASSIPCFPLKKNWYPETPGHCYSGINFVIGTVTIVLITDLMVLIMPAWIIYDVQMPRSRKLMTISFLSLGVIVIVIGILRLQWLVRQLRHVQSSYSIGPTYSAIEVAVALIATSGPTVKWLLSACIPALRTPGQTKSSSNYKPSGASNPTPHSRRPKVRGSYSDLDTDKGYEFNGTENIQLKENWGKWRITKRDGDAHSDEQRITDSDDGIMKTVHVTQTTVPIRPSDVV